MKINNQKGFAPILVVLIVLLGIVLGVFLVTHPQIFSSHASPNGTRIEFVDAQGQLISQTAAPQVKLRLYYQPENSSPVPTSSPTQTPSVTPNPTPLSCSQCVLKQRPDLVPFYQNNGWDVSSANYNNIVNNWCSSVSSQATSECNTVKTGVCAASCSQSSVNNQGGFTSLVNTIVKPVYAATSGGKQCIYSEGGTCHLGNCLDGSQNCSTNVNCGYIPGYSSGATVSCNSPAPAPNTPKPDGKSCVYTENGACHSGNCLDGSQNCSTNSNCGYVPGYSSGATVSCGSSPAATPTPVQTPTPIKSGGKSCTYTENNSCHLGNCLDGSQNCDFNVNCGYVAGYSSGAGVACPTPASSGLALKILSTTDYSFQIDEQTGSKIPSLSQFQSLHPSWVRFVYRPAWGIIQLPYSVNQLVVFNNESASPAPIGSTDVNTWKTYTDQVYLPKLKDFITQNPAISAVEIWNEEDLCSASTYCPGIPAVAYSYMLKNSAAAVKAINPKVKVIMGGLTTGQVSYLTSVKTDSTIFNQVDAVGVHPYGKSPNGWRTDLNPFGDLGSSLTGYAKSVGVPIWVTEFGIGTDDPNIQAQYLQNAAGVFNSLGIPFANWYAWNDSMTGGDGLNHWGLVDVNGNIKPAGQEFAAVSTYFQPTPASYPSSFRVANSQGELNSAQEQRFDQNNKVINWVLSPGNGLKTVYAQFKVNGVWQDPVSSPIVLKSAVANNGFQVGVNIETAPSYGYGDLRPASHSTDTDADLKEVQRMKGTLVRVFVANNHISDTEASKRLSDFLDKAAAYNINVIPVLIDYYNSGHNPQSTDQYYTDSFNGTNLLNSNFFISGYKVGFKNFVISVVGANKNHSNIYAWEIGNELKDSDSPGVFISFMQDISTTIKTVDPNHPVATGMIYSGHTGLSADQLYPKLPNIDIVTVHPYNGDRSESGDVTWASQNGKKTIVEEIGFSGTGDRSTKLKGEIDYWKNLGASAVLPWGFVAQGLSDNGDGDKSVGFDALFHTDYAQIFSTLSSYSSNSQSSPYDLNGDGAVNTLDVSAFLTLMSSGTNPKVADFNSDGAVNTVDLGILLQHFSF